MIDRKITNSIRKLKELLSDMSDNCPPVVSAQWLHDCYINKLFLNEEKYSMCNLIT
jgi:hypothetical protein